MPNICETLSWCSNSISHSFATPPWKNKWRARSTSAPSSNICCYLSIQTSWTGRHIFFIPAVCKQLLLLLQYARTMSESSGYTDMRLWETILVFQYRVRRKTFELVIKTMFSTRWCCWKWSEGIYIDGANSKHVFCPWIKEFKYILFIFFTWKHILQENKLIVLTVQNKIQLTNFNFIIHAVATDIVQS